MTDILQEIDVHLDCHYCGHEVDVPLAVVAESQALLADGCPGSAHECAPSFFARLADTRAVRELVEAWRALETSAAALADGVGVMGRVRVSKSVSGEEAEALARWVDDGGAIERPPVEEDESE